MVKTSKSSRRKASKRTLHPTVKKQQNPPVSPSSISCGTVERSILKHLHGLKSRERFNVSRFASDTLHRSRATVNESVNRLIAKGLVERPYIGGTMITDKGRAWLEASGQVRTVCRVADDRAYVRDHKFTFEIPVRKFPNGWESGRVAYLSKGFVQTALKQFSKNNPMLYAKLPDDIDLVFTTTKVIIKPKNIYADDHSTAASIAIIKAYEAIEMLIDLGFGLLDSRGVLPLIQKEGHYAEVNGLMAQWFEKRAPGFVVLGKDGKARFWVDHSNGHLEDETADETARERLKSAWSDIMENDLPKFSQMYDDLDQLKSITSDLVKLQMLHNAKPPELNNLPSLGVPDYVG